MLFLLACSDYEFSTGNEPVEPVRLERPADELDTAAPPPDETTPPQTDTGEAAPPPEEEPPVDTGEPPPPPDTGTEDVCYEPEDGYETNPAARIIVSDASVPITVTFVSSSTAYQDELWLDAPESRLLARAWTETPGTSQRIGPYSSGDELVFGIEVVTTGDHWRSGPASRNDDGVEHVAVTYEGGCSWLIGFEDLRGGGDLDYNDVVLRVEGMLRQRN
ncbi:MAG: DUF4114 domain-containing protein [Myxococcota bacterium]